MPGSPVFAKRKQIWFTVPLTCALVIVICVRWSQIRGRTEDDVVALIPQAAGPMRWDAEHLGASAAAYERKLRLYWNGPTSEADITGQVTLIERVRRNRSKGIVVAPTNPFILLSPLRRAMDDGLAVVVVSAMLPLPPGNRLTYVVNDDERMGKLAASEMARLLGGKGAVVLAGLGRYAPGIPVRARAAEQLLAGRYPGITIVGRLGASYNTGRTEELTNEVLNTHPEIRGILSLTSSATLGAHAALKSRSLHKSVVLIGCEQDSEIVSYLRNGDVSAIVAEDTRAMGYRGTTIIADYLKGIPLPRTTVIAPLLVTRATIDSPEASRLLRVSR